MRLPDREDMKHSNISAVILAGGRNSRMGGLDKAMLCVGGKSILERSISVLQEIFQELIIVTNDTRAYNYKGIKTVKDEIKDIGPLGGIYTGLNQLSAKAGFFVACDMPFLHNDMILRQIDYFNQAPCEALVSRVGGLIEPLHAIYRNTLKVKIPSFLENNKEHSIKGFLKTINVCYFELEDTVSNRQCFKNINTPEELAGLRKIGTDTAL